MVTIYGYSCFPYSFYLNMRWHMKFKSAPMEDKDLFMQNSKWHDFWWPGDVRSRRFSSHDVELIVPEYLQHQKD